MNPPANSFIEVYTSAFSDKFCDEVIRCYENAKKINIPQNRQESENAQTLNKMDAAMFLPLQLPQQEYVDFGHTYEGLVSEFGSTFHEKALNLYRAKYHINMLVNALYVWTMKIQKTLPGEGYHQWHCENSSENTARRIMTWTLYLNDNFTGGETEFLMQNYRYTPHKGDVVIFPAAYTHIHRGNPPLSGEKYIMTGWVET